MLDYFCVPVGHEGKDGHCRSSDRDAAGEGGEAVLRGEGEG